MDHTYIHFQLNTNQLIKKTKKTNKLLLPYKMKGLIC
jgi:hypothetical protein